MPIAKQALAIWFYVERTTYDVDRVECVAAGTHSVERVIYMLPSVTDVADVAPVNRNGGMITCSMNSTHRAGIPSVA